MGRPAKYTTVTKQCPICLGGFETKVGHPKEKTTCSCACANKLFRAHRTDEEKRKISIALSTLHTKTCPTCLSQFKTHIKRRKFCSNSCKTRFFWNQEEYRKTISEKVKSKMDERVRNGTHSGWKTRRGLEPSFPEKFFMLVLNGRGVAYEHEQPVGKYFIDFALTDKMVALEIDGKQHDMPSRKIADAKKDAFLKSVGWTVHRIKWKSIHNESGKAYIKGEINKFFQLIGA